MKTILFGRDSACLQPLLRLIEQQTHRTLVLWAFEYAELLLAQFEEKYPHEVRPREAISLSRAWARGEIKMPSARTAILAAHRAAAELAGDVVYSLLAHAIGQAVSTVHVETHAIGGPIYGLTALVRMSEPNEADALVSRECDRLCRRLRYWEERAESEKRPWAAFLLRDDVPNKEKLLREKQRKEKQLIESITETKDNEVSHG